MENYKQGDRVEYRDPSDGQKHQGKIQNIEGTGPSMRMTIRDEQTQKSERVDAGQVDRKLS